MPCLNRQVSVSGAPIVFEQRSLSERDFVNQQKRGWTRRSRNRAGIHPPSPGRSPLLREWGPKARRARRMLDVKLSCVAFREPSRLHGGPAGLHCLRRGTPACSLFIETALAVPRGPIGIGAQFAEIAARLPAARYHSQIFVWGSLIKVVAWRLSQRAASVATVTPAWRRPLGLAGLDGAPPGSAVSRPGSVRPVNPRTMSRTAGPRAASGAA